MDTNHILAELRAERDRISQAITALEALDSAGISRTAIRGRVGAAVTPASPKPARGRRRMSAAGRKRISEAAKARWAERRKNAHAPRHMSAATRKRLSELAKKRWAERKKQLTTA